MWCPFSISFCLHEALAGGLRATAKSIPAWVWKFSGFIKHTHTRCTVSPPLSLALVYICQIWRRTASLRVREMERQKKNEKNSVLGTIDGEAYKNTFFYIKEKAIL